MRLGHGLAALALLAGPALAADPPGQVGMSDQQQQTIKLQTAQAQQRPISQPVKLPGVVGYDPGHYAVIRPFGQARVTRLLVQPGDVVAAGQVLAELDMQGLASAEQELAAAQASVREAQAAIAVAAASLDRAIVLSRDGSLARAEADRRRLVLAQAQAQADAARAKVAALQLDVKRFQPLDTPGLAGLRSPLSGTVVSVAATAGEVIEPGRDAVTVADLSTVLVLAQVPEQGAAQVAVNDPADITLAGGGDRHWQGRVAGLAAALDPQSRTLPARIVVANPDQALRIGMFLDVTVNSGQGRVAVTVPPAAVQMIADKRVVFTPAGAGKFQAHDVQVGVQRQDWVELLGGAIKPGDTVVTQGGFELKALLQQAMLGG